jgi:hypothetical protein
MNTENVNSRVVTFVLDCGTPLHVFKYFLWIISNEDTMNIQNMRMQWHSEYSLSVEFFHLSSKHDWIYIDNIEEAISVILTYLHG